MRLRFSIRTLLVAITLACVVLAAGVLVWLSRAAAAARYNYDRLTAAHGAGLLGDRLQLCRAAQQLMLAESRLPWRDSSQVHTDYIKRLRDIEDRAHNLARFGLFGSDEGRLDVVRQAEEATKWRIEAEKAAR